MRGGAPSLLELDVSVGGKPRPIFLSPDGRKLAFAVQRSEEEEDLYVVPVSLEHGRTTGQAVMALSGWKRNFFQYKDAFAWSPDGSKIALVHRWKMWIAFADGRQPIQIEDDPKGHRICPEWSPDGEMLSYYAQYAGREPAFRVIRASGSYNTIVLDISALSFGKYNWSWDSRDILFFSEGGISAFSIADGESRKYLDLKELSIDNAWEFCWSPDSQKLAFVGYRRATDSYHIFTVPREGGEFAELVADDPGDIWFLYWSPDGKWISYDSYRHVKTRLGGEIWEADVSELLSGMEKEQ